MPKRITAISVLLILALFGCQDSEEGTPTSIVLGDSAKMSLRLQVPTNLNIDSGEITITKGDLEYSQTVDLQDGTATVVFNEIQPGVWQIHVALYDADGFMLYEGSAEAEVHGGETASAHIVLTELSGDLEITIEMPPGDDDGLIAYYPFNGNADDESGNGHHGEVFGAALASDRFGNANSAYTFDGEDDYIDVGGIMGGLLDFSIVAWVHTSQMDEGALRHDDPAIIGTRQRVGLTDDIVLTNYNGHLAWYDELCRTECSGSPHNDFDTGVHIADGMWHQVAVVREGISLEFYIDGENVGAYSTESYTVSDNNIEIGRALWTGSGGSLCFGGLIDDVRIYDRALSEVEIAELFSEGGFVDEFVSEELSDQWFWVREDASLWSLTEVPGAMRLHTHGDLYRFYNNTPVLLRDSQYADFVIETKLSVLASASPQQAGLVAYGDDDNYVRLTRGYWDGQGVDGPGVEFLLEDAGAIQAEIHPTDSQPTWLRLVKQGGNYQGYASENGADYLLVFETEIDFGTDLFVGMVAINGGTMTPPQIPADFDYFKYSPLVE